MEPPSSSFRFHHDYWSARTSLPYPTLWTRHQDKIFEHALAMVPENSPNRWLKIAGLIPGKSPADIRDHYDALVSDLLKIDSGRVELPSYADDSVTSSPEKESPRQLSDKTCERKKGKPWTKKEHQLFLLGLKKFGKGDWRSISRNVVITRTPTQVASHAQKYFLRQESSGKKDRKRSSIHDITTLDQGGSVAAASATSLSQPSIFSITQPPSLSPPLPYQFVSANYHPNHRSSPDY